MYHVNLMEINQLISQSINLPSFLCQVCAVHNIWSSNLERISIKNFTNLVMIQLFSYTNPLKSSGDPPGRGYNRCLVSVVSNSELETSSVELEQCVSSCWHKQKLLSEFLLIFTDVFEFCRINLCHSELLLRLNDRRESVS